MRLLVLCLLGSAFALAETEYAVLPSGLVCLRTSPNFVFRDPASSCGKSQQFCVIPMSCYLPGTSTYVGGSVSVCRGLDVGTGCPSIQACADDPRQDIVKEGDAFAEWRPPAEEPRKKKKKKETPVDETYILDEGSHL